MTKNRVTSINAILNLYLDTSRRDATHSTIYLGTFPINLFKGLGPSLREKQTNKCNENILVFEN